MDRDLSTRSGNKSTEFKKIVAELTAFSFIVIIAWFYFRHPQFCSDEVLIAQRWPHLSKETRQSLKIFYRIGTFIAFAWLVLEVTFKPQGIASTLGAVAGYLSQKTSLIRTPLRKLITLVRPRIKPPKEPFYMPGERWWEDVPLFLLFAWLTVGPPHLASWLLLAYTRLMGAIFPSDFPVPSASTFVALPLVLSFASLGLAALSSLPQMIRAAGVVIKGLWKYSPSGYWTCVRAELIKVDELSGSDFWWPTSSRFDRSRVKLHHRLLAYCFLFIFLWLIWPGVAYLYLVSCALWFAAILFYLLAQVTSIGLRFGRLPRVSPAIALANLLVGCWLGLSG